VTPRDPPPSRTGSAADDGCSSAELALLRSEERFRLLVEAVHDYAIFMLAPDGTVTTWNGGAERLAGYLAEEIIGRDVSILYSSDDVRGGTPRCNLDAAVRAGRHEDEGWRVRKDGSRFWANVIITALRDARGELLGFAKVTHDMTDRVHAGEQFRLAIEATPTGMIMVDRTGVIALANAQIETLFGYSRGELIGQAVEVLVPVRFRSQHPHFRSSFLVDPKTRLMGGGRELYGLRKDGTEVPVEIGLNPLRTSEGEFVLSSVIDITERKRSMAQELERVGLAARLHAGGAARRETRSGRPRR
jgi:PAS domain S-box-containing protein